MKKYLLIGLTAISLCLGGCGTSSQEAESQSYTINADESVTFGDYVVKKEHSEIIEADGGYVLQITFLFTNNGEQDTNFAAALTKSAFQKDEQLQDYANETTQTNETTNIKPGSSIDIILAYKLKDDSDVKFEIGQANSTKEERLVTNYTINRN